MENINIITSIGGILLTALLTYGITRIGKGTDARAAAEAALIGTGPTIIAEQNRRITEMQREIDRLWEGLQRAYSAERECREELSTVRHNNRDLQQKIVVLERRLGTLEGKA